MAPQNVLPTTRRSLRDLLVSETAMLVYMALIVLIGHMIANGLYGYQRDEFYYVTCGQHPAWGYVDHPPLTPMVARLIQGLFGDTLFGLRFFPTVAGALVVLLTGLMARELGGNRFAQFASALCVMIAPLYIAANGLLMPIAFDQLAWTLLSYLLLRHIKTGKDHYWLFIGLVVGIGLLNKHTVFFYVFGMVVGLLAAGPRRVFRSPWFWAGALIAFLIFLPNLLWQIQNHGPTLEFLHNLNQHTMRKISRPAFLLWQVILINPCTLPFWIAGLGYFLFRPEGRPYRVFGWIYGVILAILLIANGKPYYLGSIYPTLLAAGPLALMQMYEPARWRKLKPVLVGVMVVGITLASPVALPALPKEISLRYHVGRIDRDFAEILGWDELVQQVADVYYQRLTPQEREKAVILTENYGEAGAIDVLGAKHGLPHAVSGHNNYYLWGPGRASGEVCVAVGYQGVVLRRFFDDVRIVGFITNTPGIENEEFNRPIYVCHGPKQPLHALWPQLKHYD